MGSSPHPHAGADTPALDWAVATRPHPGEAVSGDMHVVRPFDGGVLVGVVDALGHGPEAEAVARLAVATLEHYAHEPPPALIARCHRILSGTRGAAMSLASIEWMERTMTWVAVGDVEGRLFPCPRGRPPPPRALVTRGGIVGAGTLASVRPWTLRVSAGDLLVFVTDGISGTFAEAVGTGSTQWIADEILAGYGKGTDDALVLAFRIPPPYQDPGS
jgi:phosphoserine phosphatase RsbX